jgi:GntR family transcriptional repressor for pyruvate dehydrogenase complex
MFKSAKSNRISHNILRQIREAILTGGLKPGDRLPSEKELSENFGVSKASLREAIRSLEALGLVDVRQGVAGGAFIKEVDIETARDSLFNYIFFQNPSIHEFTQLRALICRRPVPSGRADRPWWSTASSTPRPNRNLLTGAGPPPSSGA